MTFNFESGFTCKVFLGIFSSKDFVFYGTFCDENAPLPLSTAWSTADCDEEEPRNPKMAATRTYRSDTNWTT